MSTQQDDDEDVLRDLSDKQIETLESILSILSCISAVMSFITLVTNYCNYESRKKASSVFSFFFGISSFFISATFMIGPIIGFDRLREGGPWCTFQAFFCRIFCNFLHDLVVLADFSLMVFHRQRST
eukprot:TRINITY_DN9554_c0_g1_i1.p2 TRINITY_DN9554_c0_g1~~TRINITY_DN9554_c0_g1_i1.p2  ORF type:complete len:127 (-),score=21.25 TRINITY_DN9554_c0_g1_i1:847-1227(-)